jgi:hypothetical protein
LHHPSRKQDLDTHVRVLPVLDTINLSLSPQSLLRLTLAARGNLHLPPLLARRHWHAGLRRPLELRKHAEADDVPLSLEERGVGKGLQTQLRLGRVEENKAQTFGVLLVCRRRGNLVQCRLEVAAGDDLEGLAEVDDEGARVVLDISPVAVPVGAGLEGRGGDAEEHGGRAVVRVAHHADTSHTGSFLVTEGVEHGVSEVAVVDGASVTLNVVPQVVIR